MISDNQHIIFFDGYCNLCNRSVQLVIKNDRRNIFKFAPLQAEKTVFFLQEKKFQTNSDSILYWNKKQFYSESSAALRIAWHLKFPFPLLIIFYLVPAFLRNPVYRYIARNRYKWFGKQESCMIPSPELKSKFLA